MLKEALMNIGLTKNESIVYITLLKTGSSTTGPIVSKSGISSGKIYDTLDRLIKRGLVNYIIENKVKIFSAAPPRSILSYVNKKRAEIDKDEKIIKDLLPKFEKLQEVVPKESIEYYKGFRGIMNISRHLLERFRGNEIYVMGVTSFKKEKFNLFWLNWHKQRIGLGVKANVLFADEGTDYYKEYKRMKLTQVRVLPKRTPAAFLIVGKDTLIITYGEDPTCTLVKKSDVTESLEEFFKSLWDKAKK